MSVAEILCTANTIRRSDVYVTFRDFLSANGLLKVFLAVPYLRPFNLRFVRLCVEQNKSKRHGQLPRARKFVLTAIYLEAGLAEQTTSSR